MTPVQENADVILEKGPFTPTLEEQLVIRSFVPRDPRQVSLSAESLAELGRNLIAMKEGLRVHNAEPYDLVLLSIACSVNSVASPCRCSRRER